MRRWLALALLGCSSGTEDLRPLLPEGEVPLLARRYAVAVEIVAEQSCAVNGLRLSGGTATATISQAGANVDWVQALPDQEAWRLSGRICLRDGAPALVLRGAVRVGDRTLAGIGRDRVGDALCEVTAVVPDSPATDGTLCDDPDAIVLPIGECGVLAADVSARLEFTADCELAAPCAFTARWTARATQLPSLTAAEAAELTYPLPCVDE